MDNKREIDVEIYFLTIFCGTEERTQSSLFAANTIMMLTPL